MIMNYNTNREKLVLPEYGRLVQQLAEYAVTIKDRRERQCCAETIVRIMSNFSSQNRNAPGQQQKLWNHLALISGYRLDVDYPCLVERHADGEKPAKIPYSANKIQFRHYGHLLETLLHKLGGMPKGEKRDELVRLAEIRMRRSLETWNKDSLSEEKIRSDAQGYISGTL